MRNSLLQRAVSLLLTVAMLMGNMDLSWAGFNAGKRFFKLPLITRPSSNFWPLQGPRMFFSSPGDPVSRFKTAAPADVPRGGPSESVPSPAAARPADPDHAISPGLVRSSNQDKVPVPSESGGKFHSPTAEFVAAGAHKSGEYSERNLPVLYDHSRRPDGPRAPVLASASPQDGGGPAEPVILEPASLPPPEGGAASALPPVPADNRSTPASDQTVIRRLKWLFGIVYFANGMTQLHMLIEQPLLSFLKEAKLSDEDSQRFMAHAREPWNWKYIYGLFIDLVPFWGYQRKMYLVAAPLLASAGFFIMSGAADLDFLKTTIILTGFGMAVSDVVVDAKMVEEGKRYSRVDEFQSTQWLWFRTAMVAATLLGGLLAQYASPAHGLAWAAVIAAFPPLAVAAAAFYFIKEESVKIKMMSLDYARKVAQALSILWHAVLPVSLPRLMSRIRSIRAAIQSGHWEPFGQSWRKDAILDFSAQVRAVWSAVAFIAVWHFSPAAVPVPFYHYQVETLHFSKLFMSVVNVVGIGGGIIGTLLFMRYLAERLTPKMLAVNVLLGAVFSLTPLLLLYPPMDPHVLAIVLSAFGGVASAPMTFMAFNMAVKATPKEVAAFGFAAFMSLYNVVTQQSQLIGADLYHVANERFGGLMLIGSQPLEPMIWIGSAFAVIALVLIPFLPKSLFGSGAKGATIWRTMKADMRHLGRKAKEAARLLGPRSDKV